MTVRTTLPFALLFALAGCSGGGGGAFVKADGSRVSLKELDATLAKKLYKVSAAEAAAKVKLPAGQASQEVTDDVVSQALPSVKPPMPDDPAKVIDIAVAASEVHGLRTDPLYQYTMSGQKLSAVVAMGTYRPAAGSAPLQDGLAIVAYTALQPSAKGEQAKPPMSGYMLFPSAKLPDIKKQSGVTMDGVYPAKFGIDPEGRIYVIVDGLDKLDPKKAVAFAARTGYSKTSPDPVTTEATSIPGFVELVVKKK